MYKIILGILIICFILTIITRYYYYATLDKAKTSRHKKLYDRKTKEYIIHKDKN